MDYSYKNSENPYATLELDREATMEEIKGKYRKLAIKYHPDKNPHNLDEALEKIWEINNAYAILGDLDERAAYDAELSRRFLNVREEELIYSRAGRESNNFYQTHENATAYEETKSSRETDEQSRESTTTYEEAKAELEAMTTDKELNLSGYSFDLNKVKHIQRYLSENTYITTINISDSEIYDAELGSRKALPVLICGNNEITTVIARNAQIEHPNINFPREALYTSGRLRNYEDDLDQKDYNHIYKGNLTKIDLSGNHIGQRGVEFLNIMRRTLTDINLSNNGLTSEELNPLIYNSVLTTLDVSNNRIGLPAIDHLLKLRTLESLNISDCCYISDRGAEKLAKHPSLERVNVSNTPLTKIGVIHLVNKGHKANSHAKGLKYLNIQNHNIDIDVVTCLFKNRTLLELDSNLPEEHRALLKAALQRNKFINEISEGLIAKSAGIKDTFLDQEKNFLVNGVTDDYGEIPENARKIPENALRILQNVVSFFENRTITSFKDLDGKQRDAEGKTIDGSTESDIQKVIILAMGHGEHALRTIPKDVLDIIQTLFAEQKELEQEKLPNPDTQQQANSQTSNPATVFRVSGASSVTNAETTQEQKQEEEKKDNPVRKFKIRTGSGLTNFR